MQAGTLHQYAVFSLQVSFQYSTYAYENGQGASTPWAVRMLVSSEGNGWLKLVAESLINSVGNWVKYCDGGIR